MRHGATGRATCEETVALNVIFLCRFIYSNFPSHESVPFVGTTVTALESTFYKYSLLHSLFNKASYLLYIRALVSVSFRVLSVLFILSQVAKLRQMNSNGKCGNYLTSKAKYFHKSSMGMKLDFRWIGKQFHFIFLC